MQKIIFISTVHKEMGKCNAAELSKILHSIAPEVIFLEALTDTYSDYEEYLHLHFGVYHHKLEIEAIQRYSEHCQFRYVPVLNSYLPSAFDLKTNILCKKPEYCRLIDKANLLISAHGFELLNSEEGEKLQEKFREYERTHFTDTRISKECDEGIDMYENSMIDNIFKYCNANQFNTAVFMCGNAHRKAINQKVHLRLQEVGHTLCWQNYGS
jgi:hypothetical protein